MGGLLPEEVRVLAPQTLPCMPKLTDKSWWWMWSRTHSIGNNKDMTNRYNFQPILDRGSKLVFGIGTLGRTAKEC